MVDDVPKESKAEFFFAPETKNLWRQIQTQSRTKYFSIWRIISKEITPKRKENRAKFRLILRRILADFWCVSEIISLIDLFLMFLKYFSGSSYPCSKLR